jgi:hypothetical protein
MSSSVELYLSAGGNSFDLKLVSQGHARNPDFQKDKIHPYLKKALECKTHQAVLTFLNEFPKNIRCKLFYAYHPKYSDHSSSKQCTIEKIAEFVKLRMKEKSAFPNIVFDKIGKVLKYSFHYLNIGTKIPLLGTLPAIGKVMMDLAQVILGIVLPIICTIPAQFFKSENSLYILKRSIRHLGHGYVNIILGTLQAIPFLGSRFNFKTKVIPYYP